MISQTAEYALRAIVFLADLNGAPRTTMQIAAATQVPAGYLAKVMQNLSRARLVHSQRGINGGFNLCGEPSQLNVLDVINAVDPIRRLDGCPLGMHGRDLCPLHQRLDEATQMVEQTFRETTIAELVAVPRPGNSVCQVSDSPHVGS